MVTVTRIAAVALMVTVPVAGCASTSSRETAAGGTPSAMTKVPDAKALAGAWEGFIKGTGGVTAPVQVMVNPDGTYTSRVGASSGTGTFQVVNGRVLTKGHLSGTSFGSDRQSVVTVSERGGRPVMSGEGRSDAGPYSFELTKRN